ncbi:ABC transporter substrate-binding protein [Arenibaculum sp.]|uniref:substrate-binding periplasmic protein n=1 Tax=Arenibaculum sp. TaxID=2865862 RepID=UPI002E130289|nr:ABC transporter substrate-binding protein [Arenibaculum sp.]
MKIWFRRLCVAAGLGAAVWSAPSNAQDVQVNSYALQPMTVENNGVIEGPVAQLVHEMLKAAGVDQQIPAVPVARLLATMEQGGIIGFPLARNPEREPKYQWIVQAYKDGFSFATIAPDAAVDSFEDAQKLTAVTVNNNSAPFNMLNRNGFTNLDIANSEQLNAAKLYAGNVDAWFSVASGFKPIATSQGLDAGKLVIGKPVQDISVWVVGSKDIPAEIVEKMRARFDEMVKSGEYDAIMKDVLPPG